MRGRGCLILAVFLFALAVAPVGFAVLLRELDPSTAGKRAAALAYQQQMDAQDLADRRANAQRWAAVWSTWQPAIQAAGAVLIILTPAVVAVGVLELRRELQHRRALVYPDARGLLPVPRERLIEGHYDGHSAAALGGWHVSQAEAARNPVHSLPPTLRTYAPKYGAPAAPRLPSLGADPGPALTAPPSAVPLAPAMPLSLLLRAGHRPTADRLLLGMAGSSPIWTPPGAHVAIAGPTGAGKDHAARLLLAQVVAAVPGCEAMILDPHHVWTDCADGTDLTPLQAAGVVAVTGKGEIAAMLEWLARSELERRIKARQAGQDLGAPTWVLVNEAPSVLADYPDTARHIRALVNEGRKFRLFLLLASQDFLAATIRESSIRAQLTTAVNLGADHYTARALGAVPPPEAGTLGKGIAYVRTGQTPATLARLPLVDAEGIRALLPAPTGDAPAPTPWTILPGGQGDGAPVGRSEGDETAQEGPPRLSTDRPTDRPRPLRLVDKARAADMDLTGEEWGYLSQLDRGRTPQTIAREVTGQDGGRVYGRVRDEVQRLAEMVRNWPEGERWTRPGDGAQDKEG